MSVLFVCFFLFSTACLFIKVESYNADFKEIDSIFDETLCLVTGGRCVLADDCPNGHISPTLGLCSAQQSKGVECCHSVSMKETRCRKRGGACTSASFKCPKKYTLEMATDCAENQKCCIFI